MPERFPVAFHYPRLFQARGGCVRAGRPRWVPPQLTAIYSGGRARVATSWLRLAPGKLSLPVRDDVAHSARERERREAAKRVTAEGVSVRKGGRLAAHERLDRLLCQRRQDERWQVPIEPS